MRNLITQECTFHPTPLPLVSIRISSFKEKPFPRSLVQDWHQFKDWEVQRRWFRSVSHLAHSCMVILTDKKRAASLKWVGFSYHLKAFLEASSEDDRILHSVRVKHPQKTLLRVRNVGEKSRLGGWHECRAEAWTFFKKNLHVLLHLVNTVECVNMKKHTTSE